MWRSNETVELKESLGHGLYMGRGPAEGKEASPAGKAVGSATWREDVTMPLNRLPAAPIDVVMR
jgi:hypothetical protein